MKYEKELKVLLDKADWDLIPLHMHYGIRHYILNAQPPGDFLFAILENDFMSAAKRADKENQRALYGWCKFLYNHTPVGCHGRRGAVDYWTKYIKKLQEKER